MPLSICELFHILIFDNELFIWVIHFYFHFPFGKSKQYWFFLYSICIIISHIVKLFHSFYWQDLPHILLGAIINWRFNLRLVLWFISAQLYPGYSKCTWHYIMNIQIVEFDCYLRERTVPILPSFIKNQMSVSKILFPYFVSIFVQNNKTPQRDRIWK